MKNSLEKVLNAPRPIKQLMLYIFDFFIILFSIFISFTIRTGDFYFPDDNQLIIFVSAIILALPIFFFLGLYNEIIRYSGTYSFYQILKANIIYGLFFISLISGIKYFFELSSSPLNGIPLSVIIVQPIILAVFMFCSRFFARELINYRNKKNKKNNLKSILIYGTSDDASNLSKNLLLDSNYTVLGFITKNKNMSLKKINSICIYHISEIRSLQIKYNIDQIIIAENLKNQSERNYLIKELKKFKLRIKSIPRDLSILKNNLQSLTNLDLDINDLLGREQIQKNTLDSKIFFKNKVALITGGGGSIGYEICNQLLTASLKKIIIVEMNEHALYTAERKLIELKNSLKSTTIISAKLLDIKSHELLDKLLKDEKPHIVFHAAAYKHVPLVEENIFEGIRNNVFGTLNICRYSAKNDVENFVLISSDKAVRPTNVMGVTKRISELIIQSYSDKTKSDLNTIFSIVRFGNVLESNGSVIPLFKSQIEKNGPITLTHSEVNRFFMTIEEAAHLVIESTMIASGGEIFLLHMGKPIKIIDLATKMIESYGLRVKSNENPDGEIEIIEVGLRPGEKIYEELLISDNSVQSKHPKIYIAIEKFIKYEELMTKLNLLKSSLDLVYESDKLKKVLKDIVSEYKLK